MGKFHYVTKKEYDKIKIPFRQVQKEKPKYHTISYIDREGDYVEKMIPNRMTDTRGGLQEEYNSWNKSKYSKGDIYFVYG